MVFYLFRLIASLVKVAYCALLTQSQRYYIRISESTAKSPTPPPILDALSEYGNHDFHFVDGVLTPFSGQENQIDGYVLYNTTTVSINEVQGNQLEKLFMTFDGHPNISTEASWRVLGYDINCVLHQNEGDRDCVLEHHGGPCNAPHSHEHTGCAVRYTFDHSYGNNQLGTNMNNSWLWLLSGTGHLSDTSYPDNCSNLTPLLFSGKVAIFWGLAALSIGSEHLTNLRFQVNQEDPFHLRWPSHEPPEPQS